MTTRNKAPKNTIANDKPVMAVKLALAELDIKASTFFVAKKRHEWLRNACGTRVSTETGTEYAVVEVAAIERYKAERKTGGSASHGGLKKFTLWLNDGEGELEVAAQVLSEKFGREVKVERLYRGKAKAEGDEGGEAEGGDEAEEGEDDQA